MDNSSEAHNIKRSFKRLWKIS